MKLIKSDYIVIAALLLLIGAHMTTNYLVWHMQSVAERIGAAEQIVLQYEANQVARFFLQFEGYKIIFSYVLAPGLLAGLYWFIRNKYTTDKIVIEAYSIAFLVVCAIDFLNDASIAIALFI